MNDFHYSGNKYSLYEMTNVDGDYEGYFIADKTDTVISAYKGQERPNLNEPESLSPIFTSLTGDSSECSDYSVLAVSNDDPMSYETPQLNVDLYTSHYDSFSSAQYLTNCPTYYNYSYGPVDNGCAPTAGTMLVSFYDRYSNLTNLIDGLLPLEHSDNKKAVDKVIVEMAKYMKTSTEDGTSRANELLGLTSYFADKGYSNYKARCSTTFNDYATLINSKKNPAMLSITCIDSNGKEKGHAVLGIGVANVRYSGNFMITHYDWYKENEGDYYVSSKYFRAVIYMGA